MKLETLDRDVQSIQEARILARQGKVAAKQFASYTEEQVDRILRSMVKKALDNAIVLAQMAVEETGFGKVQDKVVKNYMGAQMVYDYIKDMKTIGVIAQDTVHQVTSVAEPVGLIMGIVPSTNPTSTTIYKAMISLKARNAIVFSPHPSAFKCTKMAADLMAQAAEEAGAPKNVIQCIETPTMEATNELMKADEVNMIIATGGPGWSRLRIAPVNRLWVSARVILPLILSAAQIFASLLRILLPARPLITARSALRSSPLWWTAALPIR